MLTTSRAVAPPADTGDAVVLYYSQTRSRQEAGLFYFQPVKPIGGDNARNQGSKAEFRGQPGRHLRPRFRQEPGRRDKTSIAEQTSEMETYCEQRGLTVVGCNQEVGQGWSKKRTQFQKMLNDAKLGRFDTIVCWKSDRLSRGMYPAAA